MVESIYGRRRTAHPQLKHDKFYFSLGQPLHRKASGEPPNLRTIAETDDDAALCNTVDTTFLHADRVDPGNDYHKPRAISLPLPTVYRDGSYLRINVSENFNSERARRRRFSEPAVAWSTPLQNDYSFNRFDEESYEWLPTTPRISITEEQKLDLNRNFEFEKRRHSDPLFYNSNNNGRGDNITCVPTTVNSYEKQTNIPYCDNFLTRSSDEKAPPDSASVELVEKTAIEPKESSRSRRRKSSLVPIPFSVNKTSSRTKQKTSSRRRFSFPLTENEQELTRNLQEIEPDRSFERSTHVDYMDSIPNISKERIGTCELIHIKCNNDFTAIPQEEFLEENKASCEKIITQWMKFFG